MWIKTWTSDTAKQKIQDSSLSALEFLSCLGRVVLWMRSRETRPVTSLQAALLHPW